MWLCVYVCACVSQGQRIINLGWHPQEACLSFLRQDLLLAWGSPSRLDWLADKPKCPLVSVSPALRLQAVSPCLAFLLGFSGLNSGPSACKASISLTEPCSSPLPTDSPLKCCVAHKLFCMAQAELELAVLLLLPPGCWGYRCTITPFHSVCLVIGQFIMLVTSVLLVCGILIICFIAKSVTELL